MNLPKAPRNFNDLFDRIIFEEEGIGSALGNAAKDFGNAYKAQMKAALAITKDPLFKKSEPNSADSAHGASATICDANLTQNGVDATQIMQEFRYAILNGTYTDVSGAAKTFDLRTLFNKKLIISQGSSNIELYFNYQNWRVSPQLGAKSLCLDAAFSTIVSNKDTIKLFKTVMGSGDYTSHFSNIGTTAPIFKTYYTQFLNDKTDTATRKVNGFDAPKITDNFANYLKCVSKNINAYNPNSAGNNPNFDNKVFWMFAALPDGTVIN